MSTKLGFSIGALGKATGTEVVTIRYYEKIGILPIPSRTAGNYRSYSDAHVRRLGFVRRARGLGFPLEAIRALLALTDQPDMPCEEVDKLVLDQLYAVERKISDLERLRSELDRLANQCRGGRHVSDCRIIEALSP
ncbi:MerR family transcriptional regulator, mercuric resistance operon regulatory protein [Azospirillaceae bacterium]